MWYPCHVKPLRNRQPAASKVRRVDNNIECGNQNPWLSHRDAGCCTDLFMEYQSTYRGRVTWPHDIQIRVLWVVSCDLNRTKAHRLGKRKLHLDQPMHPGHGDSRVSDVLKSLYNTFSYIRLYRCCKYCYTHSHQHVYYLLSSTSKLSHNS